MEQTILQIGNSAGIIIPNSLREKLNLKKGNKVIVDISADGQSLVVYKTSSTTSATSITPKFIEILEGVNKRYGSALSKLAKL